MKLMALLRERDREERNKISKEPDAFQIQILYAQPLPILIRLAVLVLERLRYLRKSRRPAAVLDNMDF